MSLASGLDAAFGALEQVSAVAALRNSAYAYPLVNSAHVIGIALLFGAIVPLDLQLAGWRRSAVGTEVVARLLLPVAIAGLVLAVCAGLLLFATDARAYAGSTLFRIKMACVAAAVANALALRRVEWRAKPSRRVAAAGTASACLWLAAIVLGRLVGFF